MVKTKIIFSLLVIMFIVGCNTPTETTETQLETIPIEPSENESIQVTEDGVKYLVHPDRIKKGISLPGDVKDVIPSIDNPKYVSVKKADEWIEDNELVLALEYKNITRVYPLQILVHHEIVNDIIADNPILITYCPLCGSGIAFIPEIEVNGEKVISEFGTSGKLFNSNLVMYDRKTNTYWTQIEGKAIVGELTGQQLQDISIDTVVWRDWAKAHPESEVLSQDTGFSRSYGEDPYGNYYEDSFIIFPVENQDDRIHPKEVVFGIEFQGVYKVYLEKDLKASGSIQDKINGIPISVSRDEAGIVTIINQNNNEEIIKERDFWFAWYAFHPSTEVYETN